MKKVESQKKFHKKFPRNIFDCIKNLHTMTTRTHREIRFLNPHDDHKSSYLEIPILGSFLKNRFCHYLVIFLDKK